MSRRDKLLSGTVEEKLNKVDTILRRLMRRAPMSTGVYIPPIPVMSGQYNLMTGVVIKSVIPAHGTITDIAVFAEMAKGVHSVMFSASLKSPHKDTSVDFAVKHTLTMDKVGMAVEPGDVFTLRALDPSEVIDSAASALYRISPNKADISRQLLDEIDKIEDEL